MPSSLEALAPRRPPQRSLQTVAWAVAIALIAAALLPLVPRAAGSAAPATLQVEGDLRHVSPDAVRSAVAPLMAAPFHALDLSAMRATVEALPWIASARIERAWPATVRIAVTELVPVARWNDRQLLSDDGRVFTPAPGDLPDTLPELAGPEGQALAVRAAFDRLSTLLQDTEFAPRKVSQNARGEWTAVTVDGIELRLGRGDPERSVALLAGPVRTALAGRLQEVAYVDLHYINGFAVGWRVGGAGGGPGQPDAERPPGDHD